MRLILLWFTISALVWSAAAPAIAENRLALVIGVNDYQNVPALQKAANDASAIAKTLQSLDFDVTFVLDPDRVTLDEKVDSFAQKLQPGDSVVFYFAGHGVSIDGRNYLLVKDVPKVTVDSESRLKREGLPVDFLTDLFREKGVGVSVLILDACRNNPFPKTGTRGVGQERGLTEGPAARGSFIIFSAGEGESAVDSLGPDDTNPNSVFTRTLLPLLAEPGLTVQDVAIKVRKNVFDLAGKIGVEQFPGYYDQLDGEFRFAAAAKVQDVPSAPKWQHVVTIPTQGSDVTDIAFSEDGRMLATSTTGGVLTVWQSYTGRKLAVWAGGNTPPIRWPRFLNQGQDVAGIAGTSGLGIWELATGRLVSYVQTPSQMSDLVVAPDGSYLTAFTGFVLRLWDMKRPEGLSLKFSTDFGADNEAEYLIRAAFSPIGDRMVLEQLTKLSLVDLASGAVIWSVIYPLLNRDSTSSGYVESVQFSPDGRTILEMMPNAQLRLIDAGQGTELGTFTLPYPLISAFYLGDADHIVVVGKTAEGRFVIDLWSLRDGPTQVSRIGSYKRLPILGVSPDGSRIALSTSAQDVEIWSDAE